MDNKQINSDWTLSEKHRIPRKTDVVIDPEGNLGVVSRSAGDMVKRVLWIENVNGEEVYTAVDPEGFRFANAKQSREFHIKYKQNQGWEIGKVYTLKDRDYPLMLENFDYNLLLRTMVYVFKDMNVPEEKFFKTADEKLISFVEEWEEQVAISAFVRDATTQLTHDIEIGVRENGIGEKGWSVSGKAFSFGSWEKAETEIYRWVNRMKIRRVASVLQKAKPGISSQISLSENGHLYVSEYREKLGQPAQFVSRVSAALALNFLGEDIWKSALEIGVDNYDI